MLKFHTPPFLLKEIKIEVTHKCKLACVHCSSDANLESTHEISLPDCTNIIKEARELGAETLAFSGGEPLLWTGLNESVRFAKNAGFEVSIYTTGNTKDSIDSIQTLAQLGINKLIFSLFGATDTLHEKITRVRGSFEKTIRSIETSVTSGVITEIHFVPFRDNYTELLNICGLAKKAGISKISVLRFVPQGRGAAFQNHKLNQRDNIQLKKMIEKLRADGHNIRLGSPYNFLLLNERPQCSSAIDRMIVSPNLNIYPCDAFKNIEAEEYAGTSEKSNLAKYSLQVCWLESPYFNKIREYLTTPFEEPCSVCSLLEKCLSGCLAQKFLQHRDSKKHPDPMCLKQK